MNSFDLSPPAPPRRDLCACTATIIITHPVNRCMIDHGQMATGACLESRLPIHFMGSGDIRRGLVVVSRV
jgi:hypothetical protein